MMGETRQRRSSSQILVLVPRRGELFIRAGACQFRREGIKNHIEQRLVHTDAPVVFDKTVLAKAIHEETDAGSGGANHFREGFLRDLWNQRFRFSRLPKLCQQ
jgi:hypothetical protein